jgi:uncharacterized protein
MKKVMMLTFSVLFFVAMTFPVAMAGDQSDVKVKIDVGARAAAIELFEVARLTQVGKNISSQLLQFQKKKMPDIPDQFWIDFSEKIDISGLNENIIQVYIKNLSVKEMKEITAFYKTDTGQTFLNKLPLLTQETMQVGRQWGMSLRMQVTERLKEVDLKAMKK